MSQDALNKRKMNLMLGIAAAVLFMIGDLLWQARGPQEVSTQLGLFADSAWIGMGTWRFVLSNILAAVAVPLYYIGFMEMYRIIKEHAHTRFDQRLAWWFRFGTIAGTISFVFIHTLCLNMPLIMQSAAQYVDQVAAAEITNRVFSLNLIPMVGYFIAADGVLTVVMILLVWRRTLPVNRFALICNPVCTAVLGNVIAMMPWPFLLFDAASESCGHLLIMVVGLIVVKKDEKQMPKRRRKCEDDDRPIINLDDEPDADITVI